MDFKDYYASLGLDKTASEKDIKQAYRRLARKFHPDVNPNDKGAEARFKEINEANEVLGDPEKRKKYDELGANWRMYEQAQQQRGAPGAPGGAGPFGGSYTYDAGGGFRPLSEEEVEEMFGGGGGADGESPFSDFFRTFFGGEAAGGPRPGRAARGRARRGRDFEHELELGLEDALRGTTTRLTVNHGGAARAVDVRIPAGVADGSRVRVAGEGERGSGSGPSGDLFLRIRLRPHPQFERKGRDLYTKVRVPVVTAVLGGEVDVPTLAGKVLRLKVPAGTQNGQVFRLRGHGLPATGKADEVGELYATVDVQVPAQLAPDARAHWEALRDLSAKV